MMNDFDLSRYDYTQDKRMMSMDDVHVHMLRRAVDLDTGIPCEDRVVVEIGSYRGRSTTALVHALEAGAIGLLHVVEVNPTQELVRLITESTCKDKIHLHTWPFWELDVEVNHMAFIDGDHRWPALADALACLALDVPIIAMHDSQSYPTLPKCWGAYTAANVLRKAKGRTVWEDAEKREGADTWRGFFVSASVPVEAMG